MRKNRTKHEAKKPRLAKRALALCFALIFVCSCLLPAFANSEGALPTDPLTMEQQQDEQQPTDPVLLNEGGTDPTEGGEQDPSANNPTEGNEQKTTDNPTEGNEQQPTEPEQPKNEDSTKQQGNEQTKPEEPKTEGTTESKDSTEEQPKNEGTTGETKPEETKPEGTTEETKPEEPKRPTTNTTGDTIEQGEATYTYRFWPDKIDAFDLEAINADVKSGTSLNDAAQSRVNMVPCTILTVMDHAYLGDYKTNVQQPTKDGYEFAGWYTVDGTAEDKFSFAQNVIIEDGKSKTIDVFAKWYELVTLKATTTVDVDATLFSGEAAISLADEYSYDDDRMAAPTKTLTLDVEATNLSSNSKLSVSSTSSTDIDKYCDDNDLVPILTLDITPKDEDGNKTEPQKSSTVTISGLSELELPDELTMVHKKDDGTIETIPAQYSNGTLTFKATSFSTYAVAAARKLTWGQYVYVYLQVTGDTSGLVEHTNGSGHWFLIGRISNVSLPYPSTDSYGNHRGRTANRGTYQTAAQNALNRIERDGTDAVAANFNTAEEAKAAILANSGIDLKDVQWNISGYGLTAVSNGADGFVKDGDVWHLDGKIEGYNIGSYTINYLDKDTDQPIKNPYRANATVNKVVQASDYSTGENATIEYNGKTYEYVRASTESITVTKNGTNVINLYYRDTSKKYPLFLFAKMSKTVMEKLNKANSDLNSDGWFTLGYIEDSGLSEPESSTPNPKYKNNQKYNTAFSKLSTETVHRYPQNSDVDLKDITWNHPDINGVQFGLTTAGGANDYADPNHSTVINGEKITESTRTWHLDGYIENLGAIVVNYYIKGTEDKLQPSVTHLGAPGKTYTLTNDEKPDTIKKGSVTYTLDESSITPANGTQSFRDNDVAEINLYYDREVNLLGIPDSYESFIVVEKRFSGLTENTIPKDFKITVGSTEYGLDRGNGVQIGNDYVVRWKITDVTAGEYRIKESGYEKPGYKTEATVTGSTTAFDPVTGKTVTVEVPTLNSFHATVTTPKKNASYDVKMEGTTNTIFVGRLTGKVGNGLIVFTKEPLSYAQREAIKNVLKTYPMENGGTWGKNNTEVHFYSVDEQLKNGGFNIDGSYVTYSNGNGKITFSDQGIWSMVATATYSTTEAQNPEISITNTYTLNTTNVTITKKTTGAFADRAKAFKFTVSDLNTDATLEGTTVTGNNSFTLANGQSVTIKNLEVGKTITITEDANDSKDYETTDTCHKEKAKSFKYQVCLNDDGEIYLQALDAGGNAIADKTIKGEKLGITVTNNFDGNPDTGVLLDTLPYLILLAVAVAGGVLVVVRKRKHRDE